MKRDIITKVVNLRHDLAEIISFHPLSIFFPITKIAPIKNRKTIRVNHASISKPLKLECVENRLKECVNNIIGSGKYSVESTSGVRTYFETKIL